MDKDKLKVAIAGLAMALAFFIGLNIGAHLSDRDFKEQLMKNRIERGLIDPPPMKEATI